MTIQETNEKIKNCVTCPKGHGEKELGWGIEGNVMFVGQCPSMKNREGLQGTSNFDEYLFDLIKDFFLTKDNIYFTNLVKSPIINMNDLPRDTLVHCAEHLVEEIEVIKPKVIIALGYWAREALTYKKIPHRFLPHPGAIRYGKVTKEGWQGSLKRILDTSIWSHLSSLRRAAGSSDFRRSEIQSTSLSDKIPSPLNQDPAIDTKIKLPESQD